MIKLPIHRHFLLSGDTSQIMKAYRVTQPDKGKTYYTLLPKDQDGAFQSLTISFGANKAEFNDFTRFLGSNHACEV